MEFINKLTMTLQLRKALVEAGEKQGSMPLFELKLTLSPSMDWGLLELALSS